MYPNERWPPHSDRFVARRRSRARFFRKVTFAAAAVLLLAVLSTSAATWLISGRFGLAGWVALVPLVLMLMVFAVVLTVASGAMRGFSPLVAVMDAADKVAEGDYDVRVQEYGPPPMRALAHSFNTMTERLQNADRLRRDVMADVAHELRTPLTVLQGRLEGLIDGVYQRDDRQLAELLEQTKVLSRLVEDLRTLALSDAGALTLRKEPTDLVGLAHEVVRSMQADAERQSVSLNASSAIAAAIVDLDPVRIREVLTNLLSNALQHSAAGGIVNVSVGETGRRMDVVVHDNGAGIPPEEVARIFDRFYKGSGSRGSGLGLAIAKSIIIAHGGDIGASSEPGKGTTVEFTLPHRDDGGNEAHSERTEDRPISRRIAPE
jgi:signal transduction histidine kinase